MATGDCGLAGEIFQLAKVALIMITGTSLTVTAAFYECLGERYDRDVFQIMFGAGFGLISAGCLSLTYSLWHPLWTAWRARVRERRKLEPPGGSSPPG